MVLAQDQTIVIVKMRMKDKLYTSDGSMVDGS
jgi:hypothetical protein